MSRHEAEWKVIDYDNKQLEAEKKIKNNMIILPVEFSEEIIKEACIELVTTDGRPFSSINDGGFRKLLDPYLKALGNKINVSPVTVRQNVVDRAEIVRQSIRDELKVRIKN